MKVTIDGIEIDVPKGTTILQAARMIGPSVAPPAMCYYTKLKTSGGYCRTCIVKVSKGSTANPNPMPKPVASCRTEVMDGMEVQNFTSPEIVEARKGVVEFLLINHPLDCPVCDQAGECKLQDLGYENGSAKTRYEFKRREFEGIDIGETRIGVRLMYHAWMRWYFRLEDRLKSPMPLVVSSFLKPLPQQFNLL